MSDFLSARKRQERLILNPRDERKVLGLFLLGVGSGLEFRFGFRICQPMGRVLSTKSNHNQMLHSIF